VNEWAVFYADGTIDASGTSSPEAVPKTGVIAIAHNTSDGKRIQRGRDYYWWTDDSNYGWYGGDIFGLWEQLVKPGKHIVLFGRSVQDSNFTRIMDEVGRYKFDA
jgi:hypothetical protein